MNKPKHSELPWRLEPISPGDKELIIIKPRVSIDFDDVDHEEQYENARFIIQAVNSHYELVEALKRALQAIESARNGATPAITEVKNINKALSKARGENDE